MNEVFYFIEYPALLEYYRFRTGPHYELDYANMWPVWVVIGLVLFVWAFNRRNKTGEKVK